MIGFRKKAPAGQLVYGQPYRAQSELTLGRPVAVSSHWDRQKREEYRNIEFWCRQHAAPAGCAFVRVEETHTGWQARYVAPAQECDRLYTVVIVGYARVAGLMLESYRVEPFSNGPVRA